MLAALSHASALGFASCNEFGTCTPRGFLAGYLFTYTFDATEEYLSTCFPDDMTLANTMNQAMLE